MTFSKLTAISFFLLRASTVFAEPLQRSCGQFRETVEYIDLWQTVMNQTERAIAVEHQVNRDFDNVIKATEEKLNKVELTFDKTALKSSEPAGIIQISGEMAINAAMSRGDKAGLIEGLKKIMSGFRHDQIFSLSFTSAKSSEGVAEIQINADKEMEKTSRCVLAESISKHPEFVANLVRFFSVNSKVDSIAFSVPAEKENIAMTEEQKAPQSRMRLPILSAGVARGYNAFNGHAGIYRGAEATYANVGHCQCRW